jgi:protein TonB
MDATSMAGTPDPEDGGSNINNLDKDLYALARWSASVTISLLVHGLMVALALRWQAEAGVVEPTATIVIELSPVLAAPQVQELETPPVPQQAQADNPPEKTVEKDVEEEGKVAEEKFEAKPELAEIQPPKVMEEVEAARVQPSAQKIETVEIEEKSDVELARVPKENDDRQPSLVRPGDVKPREQTAQPKPVKPVANARQKRALNPMATKPQTALAREAATPQAPAVSTPSDSNALPNWKSQVIGILERNKRYPPEAQARREHGTSNLAFSLNRQGRVTSAHIAGSSGSSALDAETLSLVHRVQPFPPPPPEIGGAQISLVVAIRYNSQ